MTVQKKTHCLCNVFSSRYHWLVPDHELPANHKPNQMKQLFVDQSDINDGKDKETY